MVGAGLKVLLEALPYFRVVDGDDQGVAGRSAASIRKIQIFIPNGSG
jgi:hypothetical protein